MRKITNEAQKAFWDNGYFKQDNTTVLNGTMQLYKTMIAIWADGLLTLNSGGYRTVTTKERLNGALSRMGYQIRQRKGNGMSITLKPKRVYYFMTVYNSVFKRGSK